MSNEEDIFLSNVLDAESGGILKIPGQFRTTPGIINKP